MDTVIAVCPDADFISRSTNGGDDFEGMLKYGIIVVLFSVLIVLLALPQYIPLRDFESTEKLMQWLAEDDTNEVEDPNWDSMT